MLTEHKKTRRDNLYYPASGGIIEKYRGNRIKYLIACEVAKGHKVKGSCQAGMA